LHKCIKAKDLSFHGFSFCEITKPISQLLAINEDEST